MEVTCSMEQGNKNNGNEKVAFKPPETLQEFQELARIMGSPYFFEKDRRAREFLKKHPIPEEYRVNKKK